MSRKITVAIDGPGGSGKSTTARTTAAKLGYLYIDSGAMYRAVTLKVMEEKIDINDEDEVVRVTRGVKIEFVQSEDKTIVLVDGMDRSDDIRSPDIAKNISKIAANERVRHHLVLYQQELGKNGGIIMDGRDVGTVVFPNAELKIYMEASLDERAKRRLQEFEKAGKKTTLCDVAVDLYDRDNADLIRKTGPLKMADDAFICDTTNKSPEETVEWVVNLIKKLECSK